MSKYVLRLFITGQTARAQRAVANLRRLCDAELGSEYELTIIDVLEQPELADENRIIATPTLLKVLPPPVRRIIGDLSEREKLLIGLDLYDRAEITVKAEEH